MAETPRNCQDCSFIKGNECYQYSGENMDDCGLVNGQWYNIEDLITALKCAGFSTTTTTSSTSAGGGGNCNNCICLLVEGFNNIWGQLGNATVTFTYKLYRNSTKSELLLQRSLGGGINDVYTHFGALSFDGPVYLDIVVDVVTVDGEPFSSFGDDLDLVIVANDLLVYARSIAIPNGGLNLFPSLPVLPTGRVKLILFNNRFDTNLNEGQGILAVGGNRFPDSPFLVKIDLIGGGMVGSPELNWPYLPDSTTEYVYSNFDTTYYSQNATQMDIEVSGTNNEPFPIKVEYSFSADPELDHTDIIISGNSYLKTVTLSTEQAINNDILIRILK